MELPETGQVPEQHPGHELSQDGRLADPPRKMSADQGRSNDDGEAQGESAEGVERDLGAARQRKSARKKQYGGHHQHDVAGRSDSPHQRSAKR
jgi:hypothetical protein